MENEQRRIDDAELSLLQQMEARRGKLYTDLGAVTHQIRNLEQQREAASGELDHLDRESMAFSNRLTKKYDLAQNARIDLSTGAIN